MAPPFVLVLNSGSSSLKFSLFNITTGEEVFAGLCERLGLNDSNASISYITSGQSKAQTIANAGHKEALEALIKLLGEHALLNDLSAVGHRVVHGGEFFYDSVVITEDVLKKIESCTPLAPLHNPANIQGIKVMRSLFPKLPQVAVFDTAFHQTMPKEAYTYALPYELYEKHGVRRYGFHGTSHKYVAAQACERLALPANDHRIITAHLGNGCSATAVYNGKSVDTTMGMTPLEGLVMGTRCGDIDPSLHEFLANTLKIELADITNILNKESGLLGVSGLSNDMRTLCDAAENGHKQAKLAIALFCYRLAKSICALAMPLGRIDALVFTGGIGENARVIRALTLNNLSLLGFELDETLNASNGCKLKGLITTTTSTKALVIKTAEEWAIAQDTARLIHAN